MFGRDGRWDSGRHQHVTKHDRSEIESSCDVMKINKYDEVVDWLATSYFGDFNHGVQTMKPFCQLVDVLLLNLRLALVLNG